MHEIFIPMGSRTQQYFGGFFLGAVLTALAYGPVVADETIGWVENAKLYPGAVTLHARIDTGAKESSLRSDRIRLFERDGAKWIHIEVGDRKGHLHVIERPIVRTVRIKRRDETPEKRPVILLGICVDSTYKEVPVTVVVRSGFNYPLLIGRNFLAGNFLVDSSRTFVTRPVCTNPSRG